MARRMSPEHKLADKITESLIREDFDPARFAYVFRNCGWIIQNKMFKVMIQLIAHWSIDFDNGEWRGSDDYMRMVTNAKRLQDTVNQWDMYN